MSDQVQFDEDSFSYGAARPRSGAPSSGRNPGGPSYNLPPDAQNEPKMVQWMLRHGIAKSVKSAQIILVAVIALDFIITILIIKLFL